MRNTQTLAADQKPYCEKQLAFVSRQLKHMLDKYGNDGFHSYLIGECYCFLRLHVIESHQNIKTSISYFSSTRKNDGTQHGRIKELESSRHISQTSLLPPPTKAHQ
ncbi:hypothetical protein EVAR_29787_1 [Eumeta japonica]|uniref:Uncharacterized protein n=1 Tax=Eumeta variegata TaxID=151549 RepID=A0A4C1XPZ5_EUMVA|nr:hypothetical protein EVAR_29787_1 [Eumeta japonica]